MTNLHGVQRMASANSPGRSSSIHKDGAKAESSPRALHRFGPPMNMSGTMGTARVHSRAGAPPPNPSPRVTSGHAEPPKVSTTSRRQNVPAVRPRRSPSQDLNGTTISGGSTGSAQPQSSLTSSHKASGNLSSRATPLSSRAHGHDGAYRFDWHSRNGELHEIEAEHEEVCVAVAGGSSRGSVAHSPSLSKSRSLQGITEPTDTQATPTPPMSCRGAPDRGMRGAADGAMQVEVLSARLRTNNPMAGVQPIGRVHSGCDSRIGQPPTVTTAPNRMMRFAAPPSASSGSTPAGAALRRTQNQTSRSSLQPASGRRLSPSESANSLRHSDAGSGGTGDRDTVQHGAPVPGSWSLQLSRSTPALMSGRLGPRDSANATPRPQPTSARVR